MFIIRRDLEEEKDQLLRLMYELRLGNLDGENEEKMLQYKEAEERIVEINRILQAIRLGYYRL